MSEECESSRERPSRHGRILGKALAEMVEAGMQASPGMALDVCATCAFREGTMPNQMAAIGLNAFNTAIGVDPDDFACHHGMVNGRPTKLCAGYLLAKQAPFAAVKAIMASMRDQLDSQTGPDEVRLAFDAWLNEVDPDRTLNDYQISHLFSKAAATKATDTMREGEGS